MTLIRKRLLEINQVAIRLAVYAEKPAVFFQSAPDDNSETWTSIAQYPRIILSMDMFANAERNVMGLLVVDVICTEEGLPPEEIEPYVIQALEGVFFTPKGDTTFSPKWRNTQVFREQNVTDKSHNIGMTLNFDIYEFPVLETSDPDPIAAINFYAQNWDKKLVVIGRDELPEIFEPKRHSPVAYFRRVNTSVEKQTNTVIWILGDVAMHLFAPTLRDRIEWLEQFSQGLSFAGEITMLDGSLMFVRNIRGDSRADEVTGQLTIGVRYGLLRKPKYVHTMIQASWKG